MHLISSPDPIRLRHTTLRRTARTLAATVLVSMLCGCGSLYVHNDAAQQATAKAKSELDKVDLNSVFDNESTYLDDLQKREYAAVAESLGAQRDRSLLMMLQGIGVENGDGRTLLAGRIDGYLKSVAGTSDRGGEAKLWSIVESAYRDVSSSNTLTAMLEEGLKNGRAKLRAPDVSGPKIDSPSGLSLDGAIAAAQAATKNLEEKEKVAEAAKAELTAGIEKAADDLSGGTASEKTFTDLLKKVNDLLKAAKDNANPFLGLYVSETLLDYLDHLIDVTDPEGSTDPKARATIGFVRAAFGVGDAFSDPPRVPHPNALAATKAWLRYVASQSETDLAAARAREAVLHAQVAAVAQQVYYLSRAGEALKPIRSKPALNTNEGMAKLLADKDAGVNKPANAALYYYAAAWTKGFIPAQQLREVTEVMVERRANLAEAGKAGEAWLGTLKPAVATLAAYGEGGLDPHALAELLQVLGIGAIAVGVN